MKKSSEAKNLKALSWKERFRVLFLTKPAYVFYIIFASLNLLIFLIYFFNLTTFALNVKEFTLADGVKTHPITLLTDKFSCSNNASYFLCGTDTWLFLLLILFIEVFTIRNALLFRKKATKLTLFLYVFVMQVLAVVALLILAYTPTVTVANLSRKANAEIRKSITILNNPKELNKAGVETSPDKIAGKLRFSILDNFSIAESNPYKGAVLSLLKIPKKEKDTLYKTVVIPYQLDLPKNQKGKLSFKILLFPSNTLVINKVDKEAIEKLVPALASRMVELEFNSYMLLRSVRTKAPKISFLNEIEYIVYQTRQEEKVKKEFEDYIAYLNNYTEESDGVIQTNQGIVNSYPTDKQQVQRRYEEYVARWGGWYATCKRDFGDDPECEAGKSTIDTSINNLQTDIRFVDENKKTAEENLNLQIVYKNDALRDLETAKQSYQNFLKNPITAEFQDGVFNPPDSIYIRFYDKENNPLTYYLNTVLHEYLHSYSYNSDYNLDTFLDEGFTDYLKLVIASKYLEPKALIRNYPNEVEIIDELTKHLSKEKLFKFYFDQNQTAFQRLFVEAYSPLDYENFALKGRNLFYAPFKDEKIKEKYLGEIKDILSKKKNSSDSGPK